MKISNRLTTLIYILFALLVFFASHYITKSIQTAEARAMEREAQQRGFKMGWEIHQFRQQLDSMERAEAAEDSLKLKNFD